MKRKLFPAVILFFMLLPVTVNPQMPEWKFFRDREGNSYYYDRTFRIRITDTALTDLPPVTSSGIDYYFHTGVELINEGRYPEGLYYLKSIRLLDDSNARVRKTQIDAAKWMEYLEKKHGTRYDLYDNESSVIMTGENRNYHLVNSKLFYRMKVQHRPRLLKKEWKYYGTGYGLRFGARVDEKGAYEGFDYVTGVESRILKGPAPSPDEALRVWMIELGIDALKRREIYRAPDRILYDIKYPEGTPFSGIEGVYVSGNRIHLARVFFHDGVSGAVYKSVRLMLQEMVLVH